MMSQTETISWLQLIRDTRWSLKSKQALLKHFNCPCEIYQQKLKSLTELTGKRVKACKVDFVSLAKQDLVWMQQNNCSLITFQSANYPELLSEIYDPPIALFAMGNIALIHDPKIAIVGSRRPTPIGQKITQDLSAQLVNCGLTITSGMALGIDSIAHQSALSTANIKDEQGKTIAIMGCGLDIVYPARHRQLFNNIVENGLVISEYPPQTPPINFHFPQRNRIVSGLALGIIIVEAAERSGTIITARLALEQNRELFVVPGSSINTQYEGSLRLIKDGASVVTCADDVLRSLALPLSEILFAQNQTNPPIQDDDICPVLRAVEYEPTSIERIISASGLTTSEVCSMLLLLEVDGKVAKNVDGRFLKLS